MNQQHHRHQLDNLGLLMYFVAPLYHLLHKQFHSNMYSLVLLFQLYL